MFKMSAFSVDTGRQTTPPLVDGIVARFTPDWFSSHHTVRCVHKSGDVIKFYYSRMKNFFTIKVI